MRNAADARLDIGGVRVWLQRRKKCAGSVSMLMATVAELSLAERQFFGLL